MTWQNRTNMILWQDVKKGKVKWGFRKELRKTWKLNTVERRLEMGCSCETKTGDLSETNDVKRKKTCQEINLKPENKTWQKTKLKTWHDHPVEYVAYVIDISRSVASLGIKESPLERQSLSEVKMGRGLEICQKTKCICNFRIRL